jgi:hypothetical protein
MDHDTGLPLDSPGNLFEKPAVITHGNMAYCSQEAWLAKGTIMDAIVFGREYNESRYRLLFVMLAWTEIYLIV